MTAVIQATCPGCRRSLRIPSDWLHQAMRCKHCGLIMAAKQSAALATSGPRTPPPAIRRDAKAPAHAVRATPLPPTIAAAPMAKIVSAVPAQPPAAVPFNPFAGLTGSPVENLDNKASSTAVGTRAKSQRGGGWWKGPVIALVVLFLASAALAVSLPFFGKRLLPSQQQVVLVDNPDNRDNDGNNSATTPPPTDPVKKPETKQPEPKKPDPVKKPETKQPEPKKPDPTKKPDPVKPKPQPPAPAGTAFPRRALVISVHNYLYANPVGGGQPLAGARNMSYFVTKLNSSLKIPANQIAHLSDEAGRGKAQAPVKQVIEQTLVDFLGNSREQDRVLLAFVGHAVEIDGAAYLVPIEGDLDDAASLVPLKWVYEELKNCKARQKIFLLDTCRFSPTRGVERPGSGPLSAKVDEILKNPPAGVQVWTACVAEQMSYETDNSLVGVFIDKLIGVLEKGGQGANLRPEESIPVEKLNEAVTAAMKDELTKFKLTQTPRVSGKEIEGGAAYDPKAAPAPEPKVAASKNNQMNINLIKAVLAEIGTPPVKGSGSDATIKFEMLPPFSEKAMKNYDPEAKSALEEPILKARAQLWAISTANPPEALKKSVEELRSKTKVNLTYLKDGYRAPANEGQFKNLIANHEREIADMIDDVEHAYKLLTEAEPDREKEPKRWLANYDFTVARMQEQIAYLYEYQSMLGQMRKELPPLDKAQGNGWKLASTGTLNGDSKGKSMAKKSQALLKKIADEHKGTPWEVLAKRERFTTLGLEWKTGTVR